MLWRYLVPKVLGLEVPINRSSFMGYVRVGPQEVYQQNSYGISGFNRPDRAYMRLRQARPPGGLRTGEPFATLLNENPALPNARIRVYNNLKIGPGWLMEIV